MGTKSEPYRGAVGNGRVFSIGMWLLACQSQGWPHTQEYLGDTIALRGLNNNNNNRKIQSWVGGEMGVDLGKVGGICMVLTKICGMDSQRINKNIVKINEQKGISNV